MARFWQEDGCQRIGISFAVHFVTMSSHFGCASLYPESKVSSKAATYEQSKSDSHVTPPEMYQTEEGSWRGGFE